MIRAEQTILITTFIAFSWLGMQGVHELGHVVGAWLSGGERIQVSLHPLVISSTDVVENPHPLVVVWTGSLVGALLPLAVFLVARICHVPGLYLFRFFTGFCLIANGLYIAMGPGDSAADSGVMLALGSSRWLLILFGVFTVPSGLYLWHRQGSYFGLGTSSGKVSRRATFFSTLLLTLLVAAELLFWN